MILAAEQQAEAWGSALSIGSEEAWPSVLLLCLENDVADDGGSAEQGSHPARVVGRLGG